MTEMVARPGGRFDRIRALFAARNLIIHDGRALRRIHLGTRLQATVAVAGAALIGLASYGAGAATYHAADAAGMVEGGAPQAKVERLEHQLDTMQTRVAAIRRTAQLHAARVEQRQTLLIAAVTGKDPAAEMALATLHIDPAADRMAATAISPFARVERRQVELAALAQKQLEERFAETRREMQRRGIRLSRVAGSAMGGPLIEASSAEARADIAADAQFRSLFMTWKKMDKLEQGVIAIPSVQPVSNLKFTSNFGIRSDPFRGTAAMHAGVDIPGPVGTPIYATADGVVSHAGRQGGYGNMIEINHGKGIATRYGHLSQIIIADNSRVRRGQIIGLMGSTGRSTGSHLHYEVRIDGHAVNPLPFLTTADYLLAAQDRAVGQIPVSTTGPAPQD